MNRPAAAEALEYHRQMLRAATSRATSASARLQDAQSPFRREIARREMESARAAVEFHRDRLELLNTRGYS